MAPTPTTTRRTARKAKGSRLRRRSTTTDYDRGPTTGRTRCLRRPSPEPTPAAYSLSPLPLLLPAPHLAHAGTYFEPTPTATPGPRHHRRPPRQPWNRRRRQSRQAATSHPPRRRVQDRMLTCKSSIPRLTCRRAHRPALSSCLPPARPYATTDPRHPLSSTPPSPRPARFLQRDDRRQNGAEHKSPACHQCLRQPQLDGYLQRGRTHTHLR